MELLDALRRTLVLPALLIEQKDCILAAVSGGPDSLALLHALHSLRGENGFAGLYAAHYHHGLRGAEADADAAFVEAFCTERSIPCVFGRGDVGADASRHHVSIQQAARTARYAFLAQAAQTLGASKIATAHTQDDQVETVLLNILRGTGLVGLRGIPIRHDKIVRPLLTVTRAQVEAYCAAHDLVPRQDASNRDTSHYTRNRVRWELLPLLEREYSFGVRDALLRLSQIAGMDADYLLAQARETVANTTLNRDRYCHTLSTPRLATLHPALLRATLREALSEWRGSREGITFDHVERLCEAIVAPPQTGAVSMTLPAPACIAQVTADMLILSPAPSVKLWADVSAPLPVPGEATLPEIGWTVRATLREAGLAHDNTLRVEMDASRVDMASLVARNWRIGDKILPLNMGGHAKKVQDIFTDAKVPRRDRHHTLIVADKNGLLWIAGYALSERARVRETTHSRLHLFAEVLD